MAQEALAEAARLWWLDGRRLHSWINNGGAFALVWCTHGVLLISMYSVNKTGVPLLHLDLDFSQNGSRCFDYVIIGFNHSPE